MSNILDDTKTSVNLHFALILHYKSSSKFTSFINQIKPDIMSIEIFNAVYIM